MSKSVRILFLVTLLLGVIALNVSAQVAADQPAAAAAALPCYDAWQNCKNTPGRTEQFCEGVWCGCMDATYGGNNCPAT